MIGMPEEDNESCRETVEFCVRNDIPLKSIMFTTPYPGTAIFDDAVLSGIINKEKIHDFVMRLEDARDFTVNLTKAFSDQGLISKRSEMIDEVSSRITPKPEAFYVAKLKALFGSLAENCFRDESLMKHRAEHGGIDIF
jgi:radical SAM superfamily enzyme YgiQ (UPF0313 family)